MYIVRPAVPDAAPVFSAKTFGQTVRWCLCAQRESRLEYDTYDIIGAESNLDDPELVATFEFDGSKVSLSQRGVVKGGAQLK
jgi:hypothetical protein